MGEDLKQSPNGSQLSVCPFLDSQQRAGAVGEGGVKGAWLQSKSAFTEEFTRRQSKHKLHPASVKSNCTAFYRRSANIIE